MQGPQTEKRQEINSLGKRFKEERERLRLSRQLVARTARYSAEQVRRVETGDKQPGALLIRALGLLGADCIYVLLGVRSQPIEAPVPALDERVGKLEATTSSMELKLLQLEQLTQQLTDRSTTHA